MSLPILKIDPVDPDLIQNNLKERGLQPAVYDFIRHNWGPASALVAMLAAIEQHHLPEERPCSC